MHKAIKQIITSILLSILLIITNITFAFATNGDGAGNGSGGNSDIVLTLELSSIKDGDSNVPLNETFDLLFNKNVVSMIVCDNNSECFHLINSSGNSIPIKIIFPDDQVKRNYKEHIFIVPEQNLEPNSEYTLYIDSTLKAKNGTTIDEAYSISFTTGTEVSAKANASLTELADDVIVFKTETPTNANSEKKAANTITQKSALEKVDNNNLSKIIIITVIVIAVIFAGIMIILKRRDKNDSNQS